MSRVLGRGKKWLMGRGLMREVRVTRLGLYAAEGGWVGQSSDKICTRLSGLRGEWNEGPLTRVMRRWKIPTTMDMHDSDGLSPATYAKANAAML